MLILDIFGKVFLFCFFWICIWLLHEFFHCFEVWRQNRFADVFIIPCFNSFSMVMTYDGYVDNPRMVSYAGGVYCSLVCFIACLVSVGSVYLSWLLLNHLI